MTPRRARIGGAALAVLASLVVLPAGAQTAPANPVQPQPRDPNMPAPQNTVPEKIDPSGPSTNLSEKLEKSDGVITPRLDTTPAIAVRPPVPNPGTTPVIPPPGSPGGNPRLDPK